VLRRLPSNSSEECQLRRAERQSFEVLSGLVGVILPKLDQPSLEACESSFGDVLPNGYSSLRLCLTINNVYCGRVDMNDVRE
jgi:hypothetical protein